MSKQVHVDFPVMASNAEEAIGAAMVAATYTRVEDVLERELAGFETDWRFERIETGSDDDPQAALFVVP